MYLVFDLLYLNGEYLIDLPLVRRRETLKKLVPKEGCQKRDPFGSATP
jgi:ATP-dependent DNA ligase